MASNAPRTWKIGELAKRTGLTVRTLHHYDEIGLLAPSYRTGSGHRQYTEGDVARLQLVVSLRHLGLSLRDIGECLARPDFTPASVIRLHLSRLKEQIEAQQQLYRRLEAIADGLRSAEGVSAEDFLNTMEAILMQEKYFTPEQMAEIQARGRELGEERIRQVEAEWPELIARVRAEMEKGTDPADPEVQRLARRWMELVREFTGGNPGIEQGVRSMYQQEPAVRERSGLDPAIFEYIGKAKAAGGAG